MKRTGNLFDKWCTVENFYEALNEVRKGKTLHDSFIDFERYAPVHIENLVTEIRLGIYKPKLYRHFTVYEPKQRIISAPHLRDRVVQHALMKHVKQPIDNRFIAQSYACRVGKGTHACSTKLVSYLQKYELEGYCLKIDVSKFFYSINKDVLMEKIEKIIKCKKTLEIIALFVYADDDEVGIPIGSLISQLLANLMLNDVDHLAKREFKCTHYLRYMDDIVILDMSKEKLNFVFKEIENKLNSDKLQLNPKSGIFAIKQGVDFVGYRTWYDKRLIRKQSLFRIRKTLQKDFSENRASSFLAHAKDTNSWIYVNKIIMQEREKYYGKAS